MKSASEARNVVSFDSLADAMARRDFDLADQIALRLSPPRNNTEFAKLAELHLQRHRWKDAALTLAGIEGRDITTEMRRRMAANLSALQEHRPVVYEALTRSAGNPAYSVESTSAGYLTTVHTDPAGRKTSLSVNHNPLGSLVQSRKQLADVIEKDLNNSVVAMCGVGDGYLLHCLASNPTKMFLDMELPIFVIEPEIQVVLNALMIHDYTGPAGPIEQRRFIWFIGRNWVDELMRQIADDLYLPTPTIKISIGLDSQRIQQQLADIYKEVFEASRQKQAQNASYYQRLAGADLAEVLSTDRPRRPRILLLTTRFSTVLQYSTRDTAEALSQIGCDVQLIIEPAAHQRLSRITLIESIARFKPDLVLQIDHLRREHSDIFPPGLPFVCWIQDHLANLTANSAGASVGLRDFVLSNLPTYFVKEFGYPARQMIAMPQLGRVPIRPTYWLSDGEDMIYVSNWSKTVEQSIQELHDRWSTSPEARKLIDHVSRQMVSVYESGKSIPTHKQVHELLSRSIRETGLTIDSSQHEHLLMESIFDRLNNTLYRQQSLAWAAEIAEEMGLQFALYGRGWESHPRFAKYARGCVAPGAALEQLTRRSKINLQVEPYACFTHARLMTGLFAGGFFLIRDHPFNHLSQELIEFLDTHNCREVGSVEQARKAIEPLLHDQLNALLARCEVMSEQMDCVQIARDWQAARMIVSGDEALPRIHEVVFASKDELQKKTERFLADAELRSEVVLNQRESLEQRLSYATGMRRMLKLISERIQTEAALSETRKCA